MQSWLTAKDNDTIFSQKLVPCWKSLKIPQGELELESKAKHKDTSLKPNPLAHLKCSCSFWPENHSTGVVLSVLLVFLFNQITQISEQISTTKIKPDNLLVLPSMSDCSSPSKMIYSGITNITMFKLQIGIRNFSAT